MPNLLRSPVRPVLGPVVQSLTHARRKGGGVRVSAYGSDLAALSAAMDEASASNRRLVIDVPVTASIVAATDPLQVPNDLRIDFVGDGSLTWDAFGLPLLWGKDISGLRINNPVIYFSGTAATALPATTGTFYNDVLDRNANAFPTRDVMAAIALFGADDCVIHNPTFRAVDFSSSATLMQRTITISDHEDGSASLNNSISGEIELDGVTMGPLCWGVDGLTVGNITSKRWGQLDVTSYTWEVACHAIYVTSQRQNYNVTTGQLIDEGTEVPGVYFANGPASFKFIKIDGANIGTIQSSRGAGALEWQIRGTAETPATIGDIEWWGTTNAAMALTGAINASGAVPTTAGMFEHVNFGQSLLHCPDDLNNTVVKAISHSASNSPETVRNVDFGDIVIDFPANTQSFSIPLMLGSMSDCTINMTVLAPLWATGLGLLTRFDSGGSDNSLDATVQFAGTFSGLRFVEQDETLSAGNFATFREFGTANTRTQGPTT